MRIVGFDIGTHSLGTCVRDTDNEHLKEQLVYYSVDSFNSGIGNGQYGDEYSYAAERSTGKRKRVLNERRRYRNWATLKVLIQYKMCPLTMEELERWTTYDKKRGLFRQYPKGAIHFERWIRLDFDNDGKPDYSSPYQLRRELMSRHFDFSQEIERFKLGRALYHISQRRGFKSSKGESLKELEKLTEKNDDFEVSSDSTLNELKKSEEKLSGVLVEYMRKHNLPTIGCAFAQLEDEGIRVRNSIYQPVRSQYKDEIIKIFEFQEGLKNETELLKRLISEKKGEGTIFYKCPLKSQKGAVGKCTLERNKPRCPISHPKYEEFHAWCFINNIRFRRSTSDSWEELSIEDKKTIFTDIFTSKVRSDFSFKEIRVWIEEHYQVKLYCKDNDRTINYKDQLKVPGCPITARLIKLLGNNWEEYCQQGPKERWSHSKNKPTRHTTSYNAYDIWHICYSSDEDADVISFAVDKLGWNSDMTKQLRLMWGDIREGYAMLSLKAIKNINYFLRKGLGYSDAVMLAKLPDILGHELWKSRVNEILPQILYAFDNIKQENKKHKAICDITNRLIANYKSLGLSTGVFAYKDYNYVLDESDKNDVLNAIVQHFGERTWSKKTADEQNEMLYQVEDLYQSFFNDTKRNYIHAPKLGDKFKEALIKILDDEFDYGKLGKLYHHSELSKYSVQYAENTSQCLLGTPNIGAIKNPVALRTLQIIRKKVNALIVNNIIDPNDTRVVIETTRNFNDANMRWAIKEYQEARENEHKEIISAIQELFPNRNLSDKDIDKARFFFEQQEDYDKIYGNNRYGKDIKKYKLWKEQGCMCLYTGRTISLAELFDENDRIEIEHTIPRSISYDNSLANLTVCDAYYNGKVKGNLLPTQLPNYDKDVVIGDRKYTAILPRIKRWEERVERLKDNVSVWKARSRKAIDKSRKDECIRQMHLWQMELDYWETKLQHFKQEEVTDGFRNRQLVDTGLITRHTAIYLKSLFHNVDVQKGEVTALFRKIFGIQQEEEKKNRDLLSHHAIDAMMLTMIPVAAKRERMLKLFFQKEEAQGCEKEYFANELYKEIADCHIGVGIEKVVSLIESQLLVNHHSSDKTLVPSKKIIRKRGKIMQFKHKDGSVHPHVSTGDSIRGSLHKEKFFGAIKYPVKDDNGLPITKEGHFVYDESAPLMVMRIPVKEIKEKDIEKIIIDPYVRRSISTTIARRMAVGQSFKEAINGEFWMLDKEGNEIRYSKNGRKLCPIRHVRCRVKTGQGYMTYETSLQIKDQLCTSTKNLINIADRAHKKKLYAQNDDNYLFLLYEGVKKGKVVRKSRIVNYYEIALLRQEKTTDGNYKINSIEDLLNEPYYNRIEEKGTIYNLSAVIKRKTRLIAWEQNPEELNELSIDELSKRLYVVVTFNSKGSDFLYLKSHIKSTDKEEFSTGIVKEFKYMIEGRDFEIDGLGKIHFID